MFWIEARIVSVAGVCSVDDGVEFVDTLYQLGDVVTQGFRQAHHLIPGRAQRLRNGDHQAIARQLDVVFYLTSLVNACDKPIDLNIEVPRGTVFPSVIEASAHEVADLIVLHRRRLEIESLVVAVVGGLVRRAAPRQRRVLCGGRDNGRAGARIRSR